MKIPLATRLALGCASSEELTHEGHEPRDIWEMKADLPMGMRTFATPRVIKAFDEENLTIDYAATIQVADRGGDVVQVQRTKDAQGGTFDNFIQAGAPFLWAHNRSEDLPPIGKVIKIKPRKRVEYPNKAGTFWTVVETVQYQPADDLPISQAAFRLASEGTLRSVSIGFVPAPGKVDFVEDESLRKKLGLGPFGVWFREWDQIELSQTPTPMHPLAVGLESKALTAEEGRIRKSLKTLVERGIMPESLAADAARELLPLDREKRAAENMRGFFDVAKSVGALRADAQGAGKELFEWCEFSLEDDGESETIVAPLDRTITKITGTGDVEEPRGLTTPVKAWIEANDVNLEDDDVVLIKDCLEAESAESSAGFVRTVSAVLGLGEQATEADVMSAVVSLVRSSTAPTSGISRDDHERLREAFEHFCAGEDLVGRVMDSVQVRATSSPAGVETGGSGDTVVTEAGVEKALLRILQRASEGDEQGGPAEPSSPSAQGESGSTATILSEVARAHEAVLRSREL